jgi:hypothetical protein
MEVTVVGFYDVPTEILHLVVSHLDAKSICSFARVCRLASQICKYDSLWRDKVDPRYDPFPGDYREKCMTYYQLLKLGSIVFGSPKTSFVEDKTLLFLPDAIIPPIVPVINPVDLCKMVCIDPRNKYPGRRNFLQIERAYFSCTKLNLLLDLGMMRSLTSLRELRLGYNRLTSIPLGVCELPNLEKLEVDGNLLRSIPDRLPQTLKVLNLDSNRLQEDGIPQGAFSRLSNLQELGLRRNLLSSLPQDIECLPFLTVLRFDTAKITTSQRLVGMVPADEDG